MSELLSLIIAVGASEVSSADGDYKATLWVTNCRAGHTKARQLDLQQRTRKRSTDAAVTAKS